MAKCTNVMVTMTSHGRFFRRLVKSSLGVAFVVATGLMRSRVVKKVMRKRTRQTMAQTDMVICQPYCRSWPMVKRATSGSVNPPTMNWAALTAMKRKEFSFARSVRSAVITPPRAEYGMLFIE